MFYTNKRLFFIILFLLSVFLGYFINQKIILMGIFENFFVLTAAVYISIAAVSFAASFAAGIIIKILVNAVSKILKQETAYSWKFVLWLNFTVFCYVLVFGIFLISITY